MDVVWLKRDVRLHDHGPLSAIAQRKGRKVCILYLYEPDQLSESSVHGSHIAFVNEGLLDLDRRIAKVLQRETSQQDRFEVLTVCHCEAVEALEAIQTVEPIARLLAHQETGHFASYQRDKRVRRWCKQNKIPFVEFQQSGVTRCLSDRDEFSKKLNAFMSHKQHPTPVAFECNIVTNLEITGRTQVPLLQELTEIPIEHRGDRPSRQLGGESEALKTLQSFLYNRGSGYSAGISSPVSSWSSCSRLSAQFTWGHLSIRRVNHDIKARQAQIKQQQGQGQSVHPAWLKSLTAFLSRLHWRSHFIQKLEAEPMLEKRDLCPAYQHLRRQPGDWNESYYLAWATGTTGFPFVDACMRCLGQHGWLNFRMRAMIVSFATYNLWLDWKRIAPHLARLFLDYEPGIHYPQLQMQSGTTGINAMRVYSVTKQGKDQDPTGVFVRKYVSELQSVPDDYIHEPWKMSVALQKKHGVEIGIGGTYPKPIINEQETARVAKQRVSEVRNMNETKQQAGKVYEKHGSRTFRNQNRGGDVPGIAPKKRKQDLDKGQTSIKAMFSGANSPIKKIKPDLDKGQTSIKAMFSRAATGVEIQKKTNDAKNDWSCHVCTFINDKPRALACGVCGTTRTV
jgi:deoxyribodipyrimidine photo-lyase